MITQEQCMLEWDANINDGGSSILGYEIYITSISTKQLTT
jgi:hypothetical protein